MTPVGPHIKVNETNKTRLAKLIFCCVYHICKIHLFSFVPRNKAFHEHDYLFVKKYIHLSINKSQTVVYFITILRGVQLK